MDKDHIDSLAVEQVCEEELNGLAVVKHRALLHELVHRLEHGVLDQDLLLEAALEGHVLQRAHQRDLEDLVASRTGRSVEALEGDLVIVSHGELVDEYEQDGATQFALVLTNRHNHQVLDL